MPNLQSSNGPQALRITNVSTQLEQLTPTFLKRTIKTKPPKIVQN